MLATPTGPADLAVQAVVVDKEDCPELPSQHAWEEAASWKEETGSVLEEVRHREGCNPVRSRYCWTAVGWEEEVRLGDFQVQEDEEGGQGLHVRLEAAHLHSKNHWSLKVQASQDLASVSAKLPDTNYYFILHTVTQMSTLERVWC